MIVSKLKRLSLVSLVWTIVLSACLVADAAGPKAPKGVGVGAVGRLAVGDPPVTIDNGVVGAGRVEIVVEDGGQTGDLMFIPRGSGLTGLVSSLSHFVDAGADGSALELVDTTITQPATLTGVNQVTSAGNFVGPNGTIDWTAVSTIAAGSDTYVTTITFASANPFGIVRFIQYLDSDVDDFSSNRLIALGTFGLPDFRLLTVSSFRLLGLAQTSPVVTNASCSGWAAAEFSDLAAAIEDGGTTYSPTGNIFPSLTPAGDFRFPGAPAWGPDDITSAIACDLAASATSATIVVAVQVVEGAPIPTLSQWAVIVMVALLVGAAVWRLRKRGIRLAV